MAGGMSVSEAMARRKSVRAFTDEPVPTAAILDLLDKASRAPSGGNVQPWRIVALNGEKMTEFKALMQRRLAGERHPKGDAAQYQVYPPKLKEPYRTARFEVGEDMYALLGIVREDKPARLKWLTNNYRFFGAPAAIFCFMDRVMGAPQWSDCGMFLQSFMLLAAEAGLDTCPQEIWSNYPDTVGEFCGVPDEWMLFCAIAIGHRDDSAPVNRLESRRIPVSDFTTVLA